MNTTVMYVTGMPLRAFFVQGLTVSVPFVVVFITLIVQKYLKENNLMTNRKAGAQSY
jgi:hypothetical protein